MNVTSEQKPLITSRARDRKRGKSGNINNDKAPLNFAPKYRIPELRRPLVDYQTSSSSTPKTSARSTPTARNSSSARRGTGTTDTSTSTSPYDADRLVIVAITTGRGQARGEVGMAAIDLHYPHVILCQMSDDNSFINALTKINVFEPVEILMPDTMVKEKNDPNSLYTAIKKHFNNIEITEISRNHWNAVNGLERIQNHCIGQFSSIELVIKPKYYALAAVNTLFKYIECIQHVVYTPKSVKFEYQVAENTTMIDLACAQNLELVTSYSNRPDYCLLGALDRCSTSAGRRLLRASILQPPCHVRTIFDRQECVNELVNNKSLFSMIHAVIRRLQGAHRLLNFVLNRPHSDTVESAERNLNYTLILKHALEMIPEFKSALTTARSPFFQQVLENLRNEDFEIMKEEILRIVNSEAQPVKGYLFSNYQRCFAIKTGISDSLDVARQAFIELTQGMVKTVADLGTKYNMDMCLECSMEMGHHIEVKLPRNVQFDVDMLPEEFIEAHVKGNTLFMTTQDLFVTNQQCREACAEIHLMADIVLKTLFEAIQGRLGCLFQFNDDVAEMDLILSLATISSIPDFVRPTFGASLDVKEGKHPVMDILGNESPKPNDIFASVAYNFHTIAGPNMGGKTIYLKQIVLLHIMAQIGCFVPAVAAQFRVPDRIFCRIGVRDSLEFNASSFALEMKEMQYILQSLTPNSLVILDELCSSTSVEEGASIAWAISKRLLLSEAFTFSATHFEYLLKLAEIYPNVTNHYTEAVLNALDRPEDARLVYTHRLKKGIQKIQNYGLTLARATGLPEDILKQAEAYAKQIREQMEVNKPKKSTEESEVPPEPKTESKLKKNYDKLAQAVGDMHSDDELNDEELHALVKGLESISYEEPPAEEDKSPGIDSEGPEAGSASETPVRNNQQSPEISSSSGKNTESSKKSSKRRVTFTPNLESTAKVAKLHDAPKNLLTCPRKPSILEEKQVSLSIALKKSENSENRQSHAEKSAELAENRGTIFKKPSESPLSHRKAPSVPRIPLKPLNPAPSVKDPKNSPFKIPERPLFLKKGVTEDPESPLFIPRSQPTRSIPHWFTPKSSSGSSSPGSASKSAKNNGSFFSLTPNPPKGRKRKSFLDFIPKDFYSKSLLNSKEGQPGNSSQGTSAKWKEDVIASLPPVLRPVSENTFFPEQFSHLRHLTKNIYREDEPRTSRHTKPQDPYYFMSNVVRKTPVTTDSDPKDMERMSTEALLVSAERLVKEESHLVQFDKEEHSVFENTGLNVFEDTKPGAHDDGKQNTLQDMKQMVFDKLEQNVFEDMELNDFDGEKDVFKMERSSFGLSYDQQSIMTLSSMDSQETSLGVAEKEAAIFRKIEENEFPEDDFFDNFMQ